MRRARSSLPTAAGTCPSSRAPSPAWLAFARLCCGRTALRLVPMGCPTNCSTWAATSLPSSWAGLPCQPAGG
eukprot:11247901-Alexandrium_andersonii.AAC.1